MSGITHKKVVSGPQNSAFEVSKNEWNDGHDIANGSIEMAMLITDIQNLINGALQRSGGTMTGTLKTHQLQPAVASTYDIGTEGVRFNNLFLTEDVILGGTVDGVDISAHAGNADAHHASGNIKDYTLGLKTGIKAGSNIMISDDAGYALISSSSPVRKYLIRHTSFGAVEDFRIAGQAGVVNYDYALTLFAGSSQDGYADVFEDLSLADKAATNAVLEFEVGMAGSYWCYYPATRSFIVSGNYYGVINNHGEADTNGECAAIFMTIDQDSYGHIYSATQDDSGNMTLKHIGTWGGAERMVFGIRRLANGDYQFYIDGICVSTHTSLDSYLPPSYPTYCKLGIFASADDGYEQVAYPYLSVFEII